MQEIYEEVYDEVEKTLIERGLITDDPSTFSRKELTKNYGGIKEILAEWQDILQYRVVDLADNQDYERALVLVMQPRSRHKKQKQSSSIRGGIIAKKINGEIEVLYGSFKTKVFNDLFYRAKQARELTPDHISDILEKPSKTTFNKTNVVKDLDGFKEDIEEALVYGPRYWRQQQTRFMKRLSLNKRFSATVSYIIGNTIKEVTSRRLLATVADFEEQAVVANDANWIISSKGELGLDMMTVYNHLQQAPSEQSKEFRKGAMSVLQARPHSYFLDSDVVWDDINNGLSPFKAIGRSLSVGEATIKRIYKNYEWVNGDDAIEKYAPYLDSLDPQFWAGNEEQHSMFKVAVNMADIYQNVFDRDPKETVKSWVKNNKKLRTSNNGFDWSSMVQNILKPQLERVLLSKYRTREDIPDSEMLKPSQNVLKKAYEQFKRDITDIDHMKLDIRKKILQPMVLVALEEIGFKISEAGVLKPILDDLSAKLYEGMTPSDQIKASSYWHSPHVNVQGRFNSAVMNTNNGYKEWEPLFQSEYWDAKNGVRFHPLVSAVALRDEGQAMSHCVGSYASMCMTNNYHIMSLTEKDGQRLATLTVQDFFEGDKRKVRLSQNRAFKNASPPQKVAEATKEFIKIVNEGEKIKPDWNAIDGYRAEFKTNQIANQAGYDIRDPEQCQAVLDVYVSCISKKNIKASGGDFQRLKEVLNIKEVVSSFVRDFDFSQGGLIQSVVKKMNSINASTKHQGPAFR